MSELAVIDATSPVELGVADEVIAELKGRLMGLKADTHPGYEMVSAGIAEVTKYRTGVIKSGKVLKAPAIAYQKNVNAEVNRVVGLFLEIETPLREEKASVDDEAERRRKEKEESERLAIESKERAEREAREAEEKAEREAEEQERQAEAAHLEAKRKELEAGQMKLAEDRREQQKVQIQQRRDIANELFALEEKKRAVEEEARKEREEKAAAEREVRDEEHREKKRVEANARIVQEKADAERLAEERKPDREKLEDMVARLTAFELPTVTTMWGRGISILAHDLIIDAAREIQNDISHTGPQDDQSSSSDM